MVGVYKNSYLKNIYISIYISGCPTMIGQPQQQTQPEGAGREREAGVWAAGVRVGQQASRQTNRQTDRQIDRQTDFRLG
jgi:hypothetical protein